MASQRVQYNDIHLVAVKFYGNGYVTQKVHEYKSLMLCRPDPLSFTGGCGYARLELGRHRGRKGNKECELCGNECESVSHAL